jgi:hypothetical protein
MGEVTRKSRGSLVKFYQDRGSLVKFYQDTIAEAEMEARASVKAEQADADTRAYSKLQLAQPTKKIVLIESALIAGFAG